MSNLVNSSYLNPTPYSGVFGTGKFRFFATSGSFVVPAGITSVRARVWGAGGYGGYAYGGGANGGGGGGFALKIITGLTPSSSITVTVGSSGAASSSFGSYVSATGGQTAVYNSSPGTGGTGSGGDINTTGGTGGYGSTSYSGGGGGSASFFGDGGDGGSTNTPGGNGRGGAGGGGSSYAGTTFQGGGNGLTAAAIGFNFNSGNTSWAVPAPAIYQGFSIDFIGTGCGGAGGQNGFNGGGAGGYRGQGGFPGGGGGQNNTSNTIIGLGLVIVEW